MTLLISSCSTSLTTPNPHQKKYTFQCIQVCAPHSLLQELTFLFDDNVTLTQWQDDDIPPSKVVKPLLMPIVTNAQVENLLKKTEIKIIEFPIIYAGVGESVTNDQTKTVSFVRGITIGKNTDSVSSPVELGKKASVTVSKIEGANITYCINLMNQTFEGFNEYQIGSSSPTNAMIVSMAFVNKTFVHKEITQPPYVWTMLTDPPYQTVFFRIIPPITYK